MAKGSRMGKPKSIVNLHREGEAVMWYILKKQEVDYYAETAKVGIYVCSTDSGMQ